MASDWKSEGPGFETLTAPGNLWPGLPKKIQQKYSQPNSVPTMIDFARRTLKKRLRQIQPLICNLRVSHFILIWTFLRLLIQSTQSKEEWWWQGMISRLEKCHTVLGKNYAIVEILKKIVENVVQYTIAVLVNCGIYSN